jgi:hypothetical protein
VLRLGENRQNASASPPLPALLPRTENTRKGIYVSLQPVSRIFGVDDEHIIALAAILQMNGYSAKFYTSPLEALTAARSGAPELRLSAVMPS